VTISTDQTLLGVCIFDSMRTFIGPLLPIDLIGSPRTSPRREEGASASRSDVVAADVAHVGPVPAVVSGALPLAGQTVETAPCRWS
jgi:hypothetical protein